VPPKVVLALTPQLRGTSSAKVSLGYTPNSKVISTLLLHFKQILNPFLKKNCKGTQVPGGGSTSKTWSFYGTCKNLGAHHPLGAEKVDMGGYDSTWRSP